MNINQKKLPLFFIAFLIYCGMMPTVLNSAQVTPSLPACVQAGNCTYNISTVAGNGTAGNSGNAGPATSASLNRTVAVAVDSNKNMYIADLNNNAIRRVDGSTGVISTIANIGSPVAITTDTAGNVYTIDNNSHQVLKIQMNGAQVASQTVIANNTNLNGWSFGIAVDNTGNVFVADYGNHQIKKLTLNNGTYTMSVIAGTGTAGHTGDGGPAINANLNTPCQLVADSKGNVYVAERGNAVIRKLTPNADGSYTASTFAGNGTGGYSGDGGPANQAKISGPVGVALDAVGNLYFSDGNNIAIRMVSASTGTISTIAGTPNKQGFDDNAGKAIGALLQNPHLISSDSSGNVYIGDCDNNRIRKLSPIIVPAAVPGGAATPKLAMVPACVQAGNCQYKIESVAGNGAAAYSGDDGLATAATINRAVAVAVDKNQNLFITDLNNSVIRRVDAATKTISTLSNSIHPTLALTIDQFDNIFSINNKNGILEVVKIIMNGGKLGKSAPLVTDINLHGWSFGIAVDPIGNVYVSDYAGQQIKKLTLTNGIYKTSTIAGTGATGHTGDGGPALSATFNNPSQLAVDSKGNIYVADRSNHAVRKLTLNADGSYTASTFAGIGQAGFSGDGGPANKALLSGPVGVTIDAYDNVYFSDGSNLAIRMVSASTGTISTVAGTPGKAGFDDNNGKAIGALFVNPHLISIDLFGNIYIGDCDSHRIRKLTPLS